MMDFVTVVESSYLPFVFALHRSIESQVDEFRLWVVCVDDEASSALKKARLPQLQVLRARDMETEQLAHLRDERGIGEYCWTLTPFLPQFVWDADSDVGTVIYIDADMHLLKDPTPILDEFHCSAAETLLTPHNFAPAYDAAPAAGFFSVQFMPFKRVAQGEQHVIHDWQAECLGKGVSAWQSDQKFLDAWPSRYGSRVHILEKPGLLQGPWNMTRFPHSEAIAFHFHGLRIRNGNRVWLGTNPIPAPTKRYVYDPYMKLLAYGIDQTRRLGVTIQPKPHPMSPTRRWATSGVRAWRAFQTLRPSRSARLPRPE